MVIYLACYSVSYAIPVECVGPPSDNPVDNPVADMDNTGHD